MNPYPCKRCICEAYVEPTGRGYVVKCSVKPDKHQCGPYASRDKAVRLWNEEQSSRDE